MDPNDPNAAPGPPPTAWQRILHSISGVVSFAGKIAWLVDENSQALHFFMTAMLQLLDRAGVLYGELARTRRLCTPTELSLNSVRFYHSPPIIKRGNHLG